MSANIVANAVTVLSVNAESLRIDDWVKTADGAVLIVGIRSANIPFVIIASFWVDTIGQYGEKRSYLFSIGDAVDQYMF